MNWNAIGALAEVLGAAGVILSLLYLARQMRQANVLAKRNADQSLYAGRAELNRFLSSDSEISDLFWIGLETPNELNDAEWKRFTNIVSTLVRHFEAIYVDHNTGLLSDGVWQSQESSMQRWMSKPGAQRYLNELSSDFDQDFVRHVSVAD